MPLPGGKGPAAVTRPATTCGDLAAPRAKGRRLSDEGDDVTTDDYVKGAAGVASAAAEDVRCMTADELLGFAALFETCARTLLEEPDAAVLSHLRVVAAPLGERGFDALAPGPELTERYYDRMFVSSSPLYVPLVESSVARRVISGGRLVYGALAGPAADHALACYRATGFDYRALPGYHLAVASLRPDSMACELAFLAALARAATGGAPAARELLTQFACRHGAWFSDAADCLARTDDDLYARVARLAADGVKCLPGCW